MNNRMTSGLAAGATIAAAMTLSASAQAFSPILQESQPGYELVHPLQVTCASFLDTEAVYRPYVVAWLSGRSVGVLDMENPDQVVPVSIPQTVNRCSEHADKTAMELRQTE